MSAITGEINLISLDNQYYKYEKIALTAKYFPEFQINFLINS